jgi:hypothetical protein
MTTHNLAHNQAGLPTSAKAGDLVIYTGGWIPEHEAEVYELYEGPKTATLEGLRLRRVYNQQPS